MKIAHLTTVDLSLRFLVFAQLESIEDLGGEAIGISAPGPWVPEVEAIGVRHLPLPSSTRGIAPVDDLRAAWQLWRHLRREKLDILHTHNPKPGLYGRILGRLAGIPVVVNTVHGLYAAPDDPWIKRAIVYVLEAIAARFSDDEMVQSQEDLALMRRLRIAPKGRSRHLGNGVDLNRFDPDNPERRRRHEVREELGVADDEIVVGVVGRLVAEKGYPELFEAFRKLNSHYRLVVVGPDDPDKPDSLPPALLEGAQADGVLFLGMRSDVDDLYQAMDIFVLPSHREGFPRAAMEAAAMGVPVVATDIRGCREVVDHRSNGLLVPVKDPDGLAAAISTLGESAQLRDEMGRAARAKAATSFDEKQVVERVLESYRDVARRKGLTGLLGQLSPLATDDVILRPAETADALALARMHIEGIHSGFLPKLGWRFMHRLYQAMIEWPDSVVVVAERGSVPVGFVSGVANTADFFSYFYRRHGPRAASAALPAAFRPGVLKRAFETARYSDDADGFADAELLSMAVDTSARRRGVASRLGAAFLAGMAEKGVSEIKVVVGASNEVAIAAYRKMGFSDSGQTEVHPGEPSQVLEWSE